MTKTIDVIGLLTVVFVFSMAYPRLGVAAGKPKEFPPEETKVDLEKNDAQWQCEQFIIKTLDDPYKAKFDYFGSFPALKKPDGSYQVGATWQIDENAPKKQSVCTLKKTGQDEWQLVGLRELP